MNLKAIPRKYKIIGMVLLFVVLCILPFAVKKALYVRYACNILMYITLAGSLNVINGYSGQFNLGQAGFFAIGAYTCAIFSTKLGFDFWLLLPIAGLIAALVGLIVALPTLETARYLPGDRYAWCIGDHPYHRADMDASHRRFARHQKHSVSLVVLPGYVSAEVLLLHIFGHCDPVLFRHQQGIKIPRGARLDLHPRGPDRRTLPGVETSFYKSLNFMYGAFWAGVVGAAYAPFVNYIEASQFSLDTGFNVLAMVVIGGQGTLIGPLVGSVIVTVLTETLRFLEAWRYVIYAAIIILMMWMRPQGIAGTSHSVLAGGKIKRKAAKGGIVKQ